MKIKSVEVNGTEYAVLDKGQPIYVHDDGKEIPFDAKATVATISRLNGEAKSHREGKESAEAKLKSFEAITDVPAALKALATVEKLDAKKLIDAGEVDRVRSEAKTAYEAQVKALDERYAPVVKERDDLQAKLIAGKINDAFSRSKFVADKLVPPPDMLQATFGGRFKVENEAIVGYDRAGNKIFSRLKPGEVASFDEALEISIDDYPYRDTIVKGSGASGGGAGGGTGANGKKTYTRAQWEGMDTDGKATVAKAAIAGTAAIID